MNQWSAPQRPVAYAAQALITSILDETYPPGSTLPAERELAAQLGVTRPTLREALRGLESEGWLTVQQGKSTRVNDFWREGGLNVLSTLVRYSQELPPNFITHLLEVRLAMAPSYSLAAVERAATEVVKSLAGYEYLPDTPEAYAAFDWSIHRDLTILSGNPIYTLIFNGFTGFYEQMARLYFASPDARLASHRFYRDLHAAAQARDAALAGEIVTQVMKDSIEYWNSTELIGGLK